MNYRNLTFALALAAGTSVASAQTGGDGAPAQPSKSPSLTTQSRCLDCPAFPQEIAFDRAGMIQRIEHMLGCSDHRADDAQLLGAGSPEAVTQALAHLVLAENALSLHGKKMAIEMIAKLKAERSVETLETLYERAQQIVGPIYQRRPGSPKERSKAITHQSEELRRIVVLAASKDERKVATDFLQRAASDASRSVSLTAQRLSAEREAR